MYDTVLPSKVHPYMPHSLYQVPTFGRYLRYAMMSFDKTQGGTIPVDIIRRYHIIHYTHTHTLTQTKGKLKFIIGVEKEDLCSFGIMIEIVQKDPPPPLG